MSRKGHTPFHWNPLRGPPNVHPKTWISVVAEALEKSHLSGPGVADILIDTLDRKFDELGFYDSVPEQYPNFSDAVEELDRVQFKGRRMLWQDSCLIILRTFTFGPASGAFNARHPLKLEDLLDRPVVIELGAPDRQRTAATSRSASSQAVVFRDPPEWQQHHRKARISALVSRLRIFSCSSRVIARRSE